MELPCRIRSPIFLCFFFTTFIFGQNFPELGSICTVNGTSIKGVCAKIQNCQSVIADLKAGVNPTVCYFQNKSGVVCCPREPRKSVKKCMKYSEILTASDGPVPLLPPKFLESEEMEKEVQCNAILNGYIVGGRDAKPEEFPHMAALGFETKDGDTVWGCGGTLISEEFVLTAAHCIDSPKLGRPVKILLGDITLSDKRGSNKRIVAGVSEYIKHPDYKQPLSYNDIALIKLDRKVPLSRSIFPACLPDPESRIDKKDEVMATGWGRLGFAESQSEDLQAVNLTKFSITTCNEYYNDLPGKMLKYPQGIVKKQLCAGDRESSKDSCQGDSGGPLTVNLDKRCVHYVVGITSFGSNFCGSSTPGVYTNVHSYLNWIEQVVWPEPDE